MPFRWVVRRDAEGRYQSAPVRCHVKNAIVAEPGLRTVEECIALLLKDGEICEGNEDRWKILNAEGLAGYVEITREQPLVAAEVSLPVFVGDDGENQRAGS